MNRRELKRKEELVFIEWENILQETIHYQKDAQMNWNSDKS